MKAALSIRLALLPALVFSILTALGDPLAALDVAALFSAILVCWNVSHERSRPLETMLLATLSGTAVVTYLGIDLTDKAVAVQLLGQGVGGLYAEARGRHWTADYSAVEDANATKDPASHLINAILSYLWILLFFALGTLSWAHVSDWQTTGIIVAGIALGIWGSKAMIRLAIALISAARQPRDEPRLTFKDKDPGEYDAVVAGEDLGGLVPAARLADAEPKVIDAEQHAVPGTEDAFISAPCTAGAIVPDLPRDKAA